MAVKKKPPRLEDQGGSGVRQEELHCSALAAEINAEHKAVQDAAESVVAHAIRAGELLMQAKAQLPHGAFGAFLAAFPFAERTGRAYMRIASLDPAKRQRVADMSLRRALAEIAEPAPDKQIATGVGISAVCGEPGVVETRVHDRDHDHGEDLDERYTVIEQQYAALLSAWTEASPDAREHFLSAKHDEIAAIHRAWREGIATKAAA